MTRIIAFTLLALFLGLTTGVAELVELAPCAQACPADSQDEHCPPDCQLCVCCVTVRPAVLVEALAPPLHPTSSPVLDDPEKDQLSPTPRDIFHIPKTLAS